MSAQNPGAQLSELNLVFMKATPWPLAGWIDRLSPKVGVSSRCLRTSSSLYCAPSLFHRGIFSALTKVPNFNPGKL
jgi:hypothetical protein